MEYHKALPATGLIQITNYAVFYFILIFILILKRPMKSHSPVPGQYRHVQAIKLVIEDSIRESSRVNCSGTFFSLNNSRGLEAPYISLVCELLREPRLSRLSRESHPICLFSKLPKKLSFHSILYQTLTTSFAAASRERISRQSNVHSYPSYFWLQSRITAFVLKILLWIEEIKMESTSNLFSEFFEFLNFFSCCFRQDFECLRYGWLNSG